MLWRAGWSSGEGWIEAERATSHTTAHLCSFGRGEGLAGNSGNAVFAIDSRDAGIDSGGFDDACGGLRSGVDLVKWQLVFTKLASVRVQVLMGYLGMDLFLGGA